MYNVKLSPSWEQVQSRKDIRWAYFQVKLIALHFYPFEKRCYFMKDGKINNTRLISLFFAPLTSAFMLIALVVHGADFLQ